MSLYNTDTIAAIATPPGEGGVGIIRLSGPEVWMIADQLFEALDQIAVSERSHGTFAYGKVLDADGIEDGNEVSPQELLREVETLLRGGK